MFFWVFPRRQFVVGRRFGTLYRFHLQRLVVDYSLPPAFEDRTDTGFRNFGQLQIRAGEIPKRTFSIFKSRRKSEIRNSSYIILTLNVKEMGSNLVLLLCTLKMLFVGLKMTVYGRNM